MVDLRGALAVPHHGLTLAARCAGGATAVRREAALFGPAVRARGSAPQLCHRRAIAKREVHRTPRRAGGRLIRFTGAALRGGLVWGGGKSDRAAAAHFGAAGAAGAAGCAAPAGFLGASTLAAAGAVSPASLKALSMSFLNFENGCAPLMK